MYIFLDLDGVLVTEDKIPITDLELLEANYAKFDQTALQEFENVIRQYPNTKIVISSDWRTMFSLEEIKSRFSDDIAKLIVGVTPCAELQKFFRHREVLDYLESNHLTKEAWVAIDDIAEHFPKGTPLIVTNCYRGFDQPAAEKLTTLLQAQEAQSLKVKLHLQLDLVPEQKLPAVQWFLNHLETHGDSVLEALINASAAGEERRPGKNS